jgi:putative RecB family exonuclease
MKFYAVVLWLTQQRVPKLLQLMYLGNGEIVRYAPDESDLRATVRKIDALWRAIERARSTGDWRPRQSRLCAWCAHQAICPAFGGTPPPLPEAVPSADATVPSPLAPSPTRGPADVAPEQAAPAQAGPAQAGAAQAAPAQAAPAGVAVPEGGPRPEIPAQPAAPEEIAARAPRR